MKNILDATLSEILSGDVEISIEDEQTGIPEKILESLESPYCSKNTINNNLIYLLRCIGQTHNRRNCYSHSN